MHVIVSFPQGNFSSVELYPENGTMIVDVTEVNPRPGRIELGLQIDSGEGLVGSLYFERYNIFPKTFGAVELQFSNEFASLETNLYRTDMFGDGWDAGIDLLAIQTEYDDRRFSTRRVTVEQFVARRFGRGRVEVGLGFRSDSVFDIDPAASALVLAMTERTAVSICGSAISSKKRPGRSLQHSTFLISARTPLLAAPNWRGVRA